MDLENQFQNSDLEAILDLTSHVSIGNNFFVYWFQADLNTISEIILRFFDPQILANLFFWDSLFNVCANFHFLNILSVAARAFLTLILGSFQQETTFFFTKETT